MLYSRILPAMAVGCIVFGVRVWLVATYGSPTPFWDEWDAAPFILLPHVSGGVTWDILLYPHNEHRILLPRLLILALFDARGLWDPLLEMLANAGIHAITAGLLAFILAPFSPRALLILLAAVMAFPFGWENALSGFQSQFFLGLLFAVATLWLVAGAQSFTLRWFTGSAAGILTFFCGAPGAVTLVPVAILSALQIGVGRRERSGRELMGIVALLAICATLLMFVPAIPAHDVYKAHSLEQFGQVFAILWSWPLPSPGGILLHLPVAFVIFTAVRDRAPITDPRWFLVALEGWVLLQYAGTAYGRAAAYQVPRYLDFFVMAVIIGLASLPWIQWRWARSAWIAIVAAYCAVHAVEHTIPEVALRHRNTQEQTALVRQFLQDGNIVHLQNPDFVRIAYRNPQVLAQRLKEPAVRRMLPSQLLPENERWGAVKAIEDWMLRYGWLFAAMGLGIISAAPSLPPSRSASLAAELPRPAWRGLELRAPPTG